MGIQYTTTSSQTKPSCITAAWASSVFLHGRSIGRWPRKGIKMKLSKIANDGRSVMETRRKQAVILVRVDRFFFDSQFISIFQSRFVGFLTFSTRRDTIDIQSPSHECYTTCTLPNSPSKTPPSGLDLARSVERFIRSGSCLLYTSPSPRDQA